MLSENERASIINAIKEAEGKTAGEIYCVIARSSSAYAVFPLAWAALAALSVPLAVIYLTEMSASLMYLIQLAVFLCALIVLSLPRVRYWVVPRRTRHERAHAEAMHQFVARGLQHTSHRTGVLIFISLAERYAEILADAGINQKAPPGTWDAAVAKLLTAVQQGYLGDGIVSAIQSCAHTLSEHFPPGAINRDELPNVVVEL